MIGRKKLGYTSQAGWIVPREEGIDDGKAAGLKPKATAFVTTYTPHGPDRPSRPVS